MPDSVGVNARKAALAALEATARGTPTAAAINTAVAAARKRAGGLSPADVGLVGELVHGTTRMRRALNHAVLPYLRRRLETEVQLALWLGAYQLLYLRTPPHAAVSTTVAAAPQRARGLVNAVLRKVDEGPSLDDIDWPSEAVRHSYPDWLWQQTVGWLGAVDGPAALAAMNRPQRPVWRSDGYRWGRASAWVAAELDAAAPGGRLLLDLCAAPGGKASGVTGRWRQRVAADVSADRVSAMASRFAVNAGLNCLVANGTAPALRPGVADAALVDAPCSGLGALGRRSDARWRIQPSAIDRLASLQRRLLSAAAGLLRPGGVLLYSACTFTPQETTGVAEALADDHPNLAPVPLAGDHWRPHGGGGMVLPHDYGTDAMAVFAWRA